MYVVSGCLAGVNCRFDGKNCYNKKVAELAHNGKAIPLCPEVLGELSIPRNRCELVPSGDGTKKIISEKGDDCTEEYKLGAKKTVEIAKLVGAAKAIMKEDSPSCGLRRIYDGSFSKTKIAGTGLTTELLMKNGIEVITEED